ncbi:MAG: adenylosuccinate lyase [Candidatus Polarisedimenticolia bacterium]
MIPRYSRPEMSRIWSDERRFHRWLEVELAVCDALADRGIIPKEAAATIRTKARVDAGRIREIESTVQHDVIAFLQNVAEHVGPEARYVHLGLTSNDVVDSAQALQMVEAAGLLIAGLEGLAAAIEKRAFEHKNTVMVGRTHGVHAEPTTFGLILALWHAEVRRNIDRLGGARRRVAVGKLSGPVGTFAHLAPDVEAAALGSLGLDAAPIASQIVQRDRHAEFLAAIAIAGTSIERFAVEIRHLQRTEVGEVEEPFGPGQRGSSAMPHKKNPIGSEQMSGQARLLRGYLHVALENIPLWHERDISHSSSERIILPDATILLDYMIHRFTRIVAGMVVHPERMRRNLDSSGGLIYSGTVLLELAKKGVSRDEAYGWVQAAALRALDGKGTFRQNLLDDPRVMKHLSAADLDRACDLQHHLRHVDDLFRRTFGRA